MSIRYEANFKNYSIVIFRFQVIYAELSDDTLLVCEYDYISVPVLGTDRIES